MRRRGLAIAWVVAAVVFGLLLAYGLNSWRSLLGQGSRAASERERLTEAIQGAEGQIVAEMRANAGVLQEIQLSEPGADPSAFLSRLAELAQETRMSVLSIGPLERQGTAQFSKSWHTIQARAPYQEVRELAARVERERGILEDLRLERAPDTGEPGRAERVDVRFKMAALALTPDAKRVMDRALAAAGAAGAGSPGAPLALAVPGGGTEGPPSRDPFLFGRTPVLAAARRPAPAPPAAPVAPPPPAAPAPPVPAAPPPPKPPLEVRGIVAFPGGYLAIVNNQIVKVGDTVSDHRVERITDTSVAFREPGGGERTEILPALAGPGPRAAGTPGR